MLLLLTTALAGEWTIGPRPDWVEPVAAPQVLLAPEGRGERQFDVRRVDLSNLGRGRLDEEVRLRS